MKFVEFEKQFKTLQLKNDFSALSPVYLLSGDDEYLKRLAMNCFRSILDTEFADLNYFVQKSNADMVEVFDKLNTYPVFDQFKVFKVAITDKQSDVFMSALGEYILDPNPTSILVLIASGDIAKSLAKKGVTVVDCVRLSESDNARVVASMAGREPAFKIENDAISELIARTLGDLMLISQEIEKLKAFKWQDKVITKADVSMMVSVDLDFKTYELASAVADKNKQKALVVMDEFKRNGFSGMAVLLLLFRQFRKMLFCSLNKNMPNDELASKLEMTSGALFYLKKSTDNFSQIRLKKAVDLLTNRQVDIVTGKRLDTSTMSDIVLELLNI